MHQEVDKKKNGFFLPYKKSRAMVPILPICIILTILAWYPKALFGDVRSKTGDEKALGVNCVLAVGDIMLTGTAKPLLLASLSLSCL